MNTPRKNGDYNKSKNTLKNKSHSHKDISIVSKVLENAKKYEQSKQQKRDSFLEELMNIKRRRSQLSIMQNVRKVLQKQTDMQENDDMSEGMKQKSQKVEKSYGEMNERNTNNPDQVFQNMKIQQIDNRELKKTSAKNYRSSDDLLLFKREQSQTEDMMREVDCKKEKAFEQTKIQQNCCNSPKSSRKIKVKLASKKGQKSKHCKTEHKSNYDYSFQHILSLLEEVSEEPYKESNEFKISNNPKQIPLVFPQQKQDQTPVFDLDKSKNTQMEEDQRKCLAIKSYKNFSSHSFSKKKSAEQKIKDEKDIIKQQMEKANQQAAQLRSKLSKAEEEKVLLVEKLAIGQKQNKKLKSENEKIRFKYKKMEFQLNSLQNFKLISQKKIRELRAHKEATQKCLNNKIEKLNAQIELKSKIIVGWQKNCTELQEQINEKNDWLYRLQEIIDKKQQQALKIHQRQEELNKTKQAYNKIETELKICMERRKELEEQNKSSKQKNAGYSQLKQVAEVYRKGVIEMNEKIDRLELEIQERDKLLARQKQDDSILQLIEEKIEAVLRQKDELIQSYEEKLLAKQKDKDKQKQNENKSERQKQQEVQQSNQQSDSARKKVGGSEAGQAALQQILQAQLIQINNLKKQNSQKIAQLFNTKIQLQNIKSQLQNQANRNKLLLMQLQSGKRNSHSLAQSHLRAARDQIESLNRKIKQANNTLQSKKREIQNKDQFIKQYLIGINKSSDIGMLTAQLEKILTCQT